MDDAELAYRAVASRDPRFDGVFVTAVATTGIYCRPSCPARTPLRRNVTFFPTAAAARRAGYRACKRCRPDAAPGSPEWNLRASVAARALALVGDGVVEREGVGGLSARLGYSRRQLQRILHAELGVGPLELAASHRLDVARSLLESSALPISAIAFAAGFGSLRQFNDASRRAFGEPPSALRRVGANARRAGEHIALDLSYRPPLDLELLLATLAGAMVPGVEADDAVSYRRAIRLPRADAALAVPHGQPDAGTVRVELTLGDLRDLPAAVSRVRRMLDLDADPIAVAELLGADPTLAPLVARRPGLRLAGAPDPGEALVRSLFAGSARRHLAARGVGLSERIARAGLDRLLPTPAQLLETSTDPGTRAVLATAATGTLPLEVGDDRAAWSAALHEVLPRAIGRAERLDAEVRAAGFADPDAFAPSPARPLARAERWRPWRAYAAAHLDQAARDAAGKAAS